MRFCWLLLPLVLSTTRCLGQASPVIHRLDGSTLSADDASLAAAEEFGKDRVAGAQIAILNHGHTVWSYAYGLRDAGKQLPMTPDTNIWAASITKGVFATWVMHRVETHQLDLDQPVAQMLPKPLNEYAPYQVSASAVVHDPRWQRVTPRMLLAHTSGLANFATDEPDKKLRLHFSPGTRFAYSGEGLNLLQFVIEETKQLSIATSMRDDLFIPLGMPSTGMIWKPEFATNNALRYDATGKFISETHRDRARAAGSMATTVEDLARFTEALLANRILPPATRAQMLSPQIAIRAAHQFPTMDPTEGNEGPKVGLAYGIGWGLLTKTPYGPAFFKEGHGDGAENYLICFTRSGTCMILLTNSDNGELAFRPLLEKLIGDNVTPWTWESYTREQILQNEEHAPAKPDTAH